MKLGGPAKEILWIPRLFIKELPDDAKTVLRGGREAEIAYSDTVDANEASKCVELSALRNLQAGFNRFVFFKTEKIDDAAALTDGTLGSELLVSLREKDAKDVERAIRKFLDKTPARCVIKASIFDVTLAERPVRFLVVADGWHEEMVFFDERLAT